MIQQKAATHPFIILSEFLLKLKNMYTHGILMARSCASVLKAYLGPIHLQL